MKSRVQRFQRVPSLRFKRQLHRVAGARKVKLDRVRLHDKFVEVVRAQVFIAIKSSTREREVLG
ncbi:MAG: hypothetical protein ACK56I_37090, partial [bacterium]